MGNRICNRLAAAQSIDKKTTIIMKITWEIILIFFGVVNLLLTRFTLFRLHQPTTFVSWILKVLVSGLSPILFLAGLVVAFLGWILYSIPATVIGVLSSFIYLTHIIKSSRSPDPQTGFEKAFGENYDSKIPTERSSSFLSKRYVVLLPNSPAPRVTRDIPFYQIPDSDRQLLCDIWQPPLTVHSSGLAFIYLHGSAWSLLDKDYGTRLFFARLASQGHVVMDVAYRLYPETNFIGMVHDVKHAIAWIKTNGAKYGIDPTRVVVGGGSAGAHLALLTAYTNDNDGFTPSDLKHIDLGVRGVISLYGESDLALTFYHTAQHLVSHSALVQKKNGPSGDNQSWLKKKLGSDFHRLGFDKNVEPGMLVPMLGGTPNEIPEKYSFFSPVTYAHPGCPPTLFIHGDHDILAPLFGIQVLRKKLVHEGVPVVMHVVGQADHAFDLILPKISPSAHNALYDIERFLAALV
jgi:acetyl esterase/lipase